MKGKLFYKPDLLIFNKLKATKGFILSRMLDFCYASAKA
ncbi:hypothetical protein JCM19296_1507 [Nonlabens ulvanivorans]|uniref:Uncharacterized protein n=1 Tax=Nonlabens ulvanivorans TaxID=906888 RepID=A0A081DAG4_NONUL|nr:hypothetical protein JCM19296_1507 [Nonlabens ulvanivorans]